jgi:HAD superfamily hydrolase (TIGR01509 family)
MFKGVIFDFNGTLFWDTELHNQAWDIYLNHFGLTLTDEEKHQKVHGKNNTQIMIDIFGEGLSPEEIHKRSDDKELIYQELVKKVNLQLADGAVELFGFLLKRHIPFTIVTASHKLNVDFFIDYLELKKWFDPAKIIYGDGSLKGKPAPDMFLKAIEMLDIRQEETVIFEDSETGLLAAKNTKAGKVYIVNSTGREYKNWEYPVIRSFSEVDRDLFG